MQLTVIAKTLTFTFSKYLNDTCIVINVIKTTERAITNVPNG